MQNLKTYTIRKYNWISVRIIIERNRKQLWLNYTVNKFIKRSDGRIRSTPVERNLAVALKIASEAVLPFVGLCLQDIVTNMYKGLWIRLFIMTLFGPHYDLRRLETTQMFIKRNWLKLGYVHKMKGMLCSWKVSNDGFCLLIRVIFIRFSKWKK